MLVDFHVHSSCSSDGQNTMNEMAAAEREKGVNVVCFTDHIDIENYKTGEYDGQHFDQWPLILAQYNTAVRAHPDMDLRLGLELGSIGHWPLEAAKVASQNELDFIIGSIHNNRGKPDFFGMVYKSDEHCEQLICDYLEEHLELIDTGGFDVVGHLGYITRYMIRAGFDKAAVTMERHGEVLDEILHRLVNNGLGLELNCSGLGGLIGPLPSVEILRRYHELGGELITIGSDAHTTERAGLHIKEGIGILAETGFKYVTLFTKRKPEFKRIN